MISASRTNCRAQLSAGRRSDLAEISICKWMWAPRILLTHNIDVPAVAKVLIISVMLFVLGVLSFPYRSG